VSKKGVILQSSGSAPPESRARLSWVDVGWSVLLVLVVAVPTMAVEEDWHGRPMIDQSSHLWLVAAVLVAAAFVAGGAVAGFRRPHAPTAHATAAASVSVLALLAAALIRRFWLVHGHLPHTVVALWGLGAAAALGLSAVGAQVGRRFAHPPR